MFATIARFCVTRRRWVLAAWVLLLVVVLVKGPPVNAPGTRAAVLALTAKLERVPNVTGAVNAYTSPDPRLRARDGHASLIVVSLAKSAGMMSQKKP